MKISIKQAHGFTLLELMIVVAIVAILAAVALPAYKDYVLRGQIAGATQLLQQQKVRMEQFFASNRTYSGAPACSATLSEGGSFGVACTGTPDATTFTLTATSSSPPGFKYTINQDNSKTSTIIYPGWATTCNKAWITRKGMVCP